MRIVLTNLLTLLTDGVGELSARNLLTLLTVGGLKLSAPRARVEAEHMGGFIYQCFRDAVSATVSITVSKHFLAFCLIREQSMLTV